MQSAARDLEEQQQILPPGAAWPCGAASHRQVLATAVHVVACSGDAGRGMDLHLRWEKDYLACHLPCVYPLPVDLYFCLSGSDSLVLVCMMDIRDRC